MILYGDQPPFSEEDKRDIRRALHEVWQQTHVEKNTTADPDDRDALTDRMRRYEGLMEKVGNL